jgi:hypothetical protein
MHRVAAGLLCALLAAAAMAAPAPLPKLWFGLDGWDKPVGQGRLYHQATNCVSLPQTRTTTEASGFCATWRAIL